MSSPAPLFHLSNVTLCVHGGKLSEVPTLPRVFVNGPAIGVGGDPVCTVADTFTIAGCTFTTPATGPHPCMSAAWPVPALRLKSMGSALLLAGPGGMTLAADMAPQGMPLTSANQPKVIGT